MTPLESAMGAAIAAALNIDPADARRYADDCKRFASGMLGEQGRIMTMAAESAEAFAKFCEALRDVSRNVNQEG